MKIMIDILHPAHVHFFKNFIWEMEKEGHEILVTARNKECTLDLLQQYKIPYHQISKVRKGSWGRITEWAMRNIRFLKLAWKFKPDLLMSEQGPTTAPVGKILGIPNFIFWDTEVSTLTNFFCYPLATAVFTPTSYTAKVRGNHKTYPGYQKLAYLHPNRFTPSEKVLQKYGLRAGKYIVVRFVSLTSNHDKDAFGIVNKEELIRELQQYAPVYISSEEELSPAFQPLALNIEYRDLYDVLAFAALYLGESATIATEAAMLGTPSIYASTSYRGYILELQQKYGLVQWAKNDLKAIQYSKQILENKNSRKQGKKKRDLMLAESIDLTAFMIDVVKQKKY